MVYDDCHFSWVSLFSKYHQEKHEIMDWFRVWHELSIMIHTFETHPAVLFLSICLSNGLDQLLIEKNEAWVWIVFFLHLAQEYWIFYEFLTLLHSTRFPCNKNTSYNKNVAFYHNHCMKKHPKFNGRLRKSEKQKIKKERTSRNTAGISCWTRPRWFKNPMRFITA